MPVSSVGSTMIVSVSPSTVTQQKQVQKDEWLLLWLPHRGVAREEDHFVVALVPWTECWSADGAVDEFWFSFLCRAFRARIALWHKAKLTKGVVLSFTSKMRLAPNQNTGIGTPEVTWDCSFRVCAPESCFSDTVSHSAGFIIFYIIYTICP